MLSLKPVWELTTIHFSSPQKTINKSFLLHCISGFCILLCQVLYKLFVSILTINIAVIITQGCALVIAVLCKNRCELVLRWYPSYCWPMNKHRWQRYVWLHGTYASSAGTIKFSQRRPKRNTLKSTMNIYYRKNSQQ